MVKLPGYEVGPKIYDGRKTVVYRGRRESDGAGVVFKVLKPQYLNIHEIVKLKYEFEIAGKIDDEGVVKAYAVEESDHAPVLVFEDFGGTALENVIKSGGIDLVSFLGIAVKIAGVLGRIHKSNIIHKDINPNNILINRETGEVKICDFGISTLLSVENQDMENINRLEGTLHYISPEQTGRINRKLDYRTDFYSLGITFYKMLTGVLPFASEDEMELVHCHLARQPAAPVQLNPAVPRVISDIVVKLMEKDAENRYQSAEGLRLDLQKCREQLGATGSIHSFEIGEKDISDRFRIPQKLYGREKEIELLMKAFERVAGGSTEIMLVTGYSGIGKSSLVNEISKPIVENRGYFVSGKFDQYKRNIPYFAVAQAFGEIITQILAESDEKIKIWKDTLLKALGINGKIITDMIPVLEMLIGKQPDILELPSAEAQNRFSLTVLNFVKVFARSGHPLVIFLDDLQWADLPSLKLMETITADSGIRNMLIIAAYRENEVDDAHPLVQVMDGIRKSGTVTGEIVLNNLGLEHVGQLIAGTLKCDYEKALPLARLCVEKTRGNPFFLSQFLHSMYGKGYIKFDLPGAEWQWDLDRVRQETVTDNVIDLMVGKIRGLSRNTQDILKLAACIGNTFDLRLLSIISEKSAADVSDALWEAVKENLIYPLGDSYKYIREIDDITVSYRFLHDRVQQAAYELFGEALKKETHLRIGRLLLKNIPANERVDKIFDIIKHLNLGMQLVESQEERDTFAELNLAAGRRAKASVAFEPAYSYLTVCLELLGEEVWKRNYDLALPVYNEAAEMAYASGSYVEMEEIVEHVLKYAKTRLDCVRAYETRILAYTAQSRLPEAIQTSIGALGALGVNVPQNPGMVDIMKAFLRIKSILLGKKAESLAGLPAMTDPVKLAILEVIHRIVPGAYLSSPMFFISVSLKNVILSIQYGNSVVSSHGYLSYGMFLCGIIGDIDSGYRFGRLALSLVEKESLQALKVRIIAMYYAFIGHWKEHLEDSLGPLREVYQAALEMGDFDYAAYAASFYFVNARDSGKELSSLEREINLYMPALKRMKKIVAAYAAHEYLHFIAAMKNPAERGYDFYTSSPDEQRRIDQFQKMNYTGGLFSLYFHKLVLCCVFEDYEGAVRSMEAVEKYKGGMGLFASNLVHFYSSLALLPVLEGAKEKARQKPLRKKLRKSIKQVEKLAHHAPMNFLHKLYLIEAEKFRIGKLYGKAAEYYDKAIELAAKNRYVQDEALANELAAKFYYSRGKAKIGNLYLKEAYSCYIKWGAAVKVKYLEEKYPEVFHEAAAAKEDFLETTAGTSVDRTSDILDTSSILKATQALSGEIVLEKLLEKLVKIVLENAGAQRLAFLMKKGSGLVIQAMGDLNGDRIAVMQDISIHQGQSVPVSIINHVSRTRESVVLDDAAASGDFMADAYILSHKPKSIMCTPIISKGELEGVLYLENNSITGAFTADRIKMLSILSSQIAISIENANLYTNLDGLVTERTKELSEALENLEKTQDQLIESTKLAALGQLIAGIAHEINTPLGAIQASIANISDYLQQTYESIPRLLTILSGDEQKLFFDLIERSVKNEAALSSREERKLKRELAARLEQLGFQDAEGTADLLADMGIFGDIETYLPLLRHRESAFLAQTAHSLSGLQRNCKNISLATMRASKMVFALKNYAREDQSGEMVKADIISGIETTLVLYHNQIKHTVRVVKNYSEVPQILCYPDELNQVWTNLILNGLQAMEYNGTMEIDVLRDGGDILVKITDSGKGIPEEIKDKIFTPFFTTKPQGEGTGLGLDIVKKIIIKHKGDIGVESVPGRTVFTVRLPVI